LNGQLHALTASPLGKEPHSTHWIEGLVGRPHRARLEMMVRRKNHNPC